MHQRFDLDAIKADYDMRQVYPVTPHRKDYNGYSLDVCIFHDDAKPSMLIGKDWFKCRAACPHGRGDIISWTMRSAGVNFVEACTMLAEHRAPLAMNGIAYAERPHLPPPVFKRDLPDEYVDGMSTQDYLDLQRLTGISRATAVEHQIGRFDYHIYTIPVHHPETGEVIDMKLYRPDAIKGEQLKTWHLEKGAPNALYGVKYLNGDNYAVIVGGEKDAINGHEMHLPFVTDTAGESSWDEAFTAWLERREKLYVWLDADPTGWAGTDRVLRSSKLPTGSARVAHGGGLRRAIPCHWELLWSPDVKKGYDFSDFKAEGGTREMFLQMLRNAELGIWDKPLKPTIPADKLIPPDFNPLKGRIG